MKTNQRAKVIWLILGVFVGVTLMQFWPQTPLHATATDRREGFAIATGAMGDGVEAIYFLDFLTGDLSAAVISRHTSKFAAVYKRNILQDFGITNPANSPKFLMVTGQVNLIRGQAGLRPSDAALYIAELNSGTVAAYAVPWDKTALASGRPFEGTFLPLDRTQFRSAPVRR